MKACDYITGYVQNTFALLIMITDSGETDSFLQVGLKASCKHILGGDCLQFRDACIMIKVDVQVREPGRSNTI